MTASDDSKSDGSHDGKIIDDEKGAGVATNPPLAFHRRAWYAHVPFTSREPPPPPKSSIDDAAILPEVTASFLSLLTFNWMNPILSLGYRRPLEASDLYTLQDPRKSAVIASRILDSFDRRTKEAAEYNKRLADGHIRPGLRALWWTLRGQRELREEQWRTKHGRRKASLVYAINDSVKWFFWSAAALKILGDTATVTSPLVVKAIINFSTESYAKHQAGVHEGLPPVGKGVGLAFALLALQVTGSFGVHHFFYRSAGTGVLVRGGLITAIYQRSLQLSNRARSALPNGKLVNHISTDVSRIDFCCGFFHMSWTALIQLAICLALLILQLGPSALAGFALFVIVTPVQAWAMKQSFKFRGSSMVWTDKRAKLLQELLSGMKVIKFFTWETPFLARIFGYRRKEMKLIRSLLLIRAANNAVAMSLPTLASVLSFVTYAMAGNELSAAVIFTSLTLFNILRLPLMMLPMSLSAIVDGHNAVGRIYGVFEAELLDGTHTIENNLPNAIEVNDGSFTWDLPAPDEGLPKSSKTKKKEKRATKRAAKLADGPPAPKTEADQSVFKMSHINLTIPKGKLVAIVGPVGTGKSSLLQAMIGEMRKTGGEVAFGGSVGYCPQTAWIQNATVRENITFGRPFEEKRYWKAVEDACLMPDLELLPNGEMTEVGEKGISLSGGQKQRLNVARAIYCNADIQLFDDPLSALDAHVGKAVFHNVLLNAPPGKTRVLVTHALHFLPQVDYIYTVIDGHIAERGTYPELMYSGGEFSRFVTEFGAQDEQDEKEEDAIEDVSSVSNLSDEKKAIGRKKAVAGAALMQVEERNTGAVTGRIYKKYLEGPGMTLMPIWVVSLVLTQATTVMSSYWLVYWQERHWPYPPSFYMGIYAGLGVGQATALFFTGSIFAMLTYFASQRLHRAAIERVMRAPMSFFETTPLGRIMNRFSKDIDTIDNLLGDSARMLTMTASNIAGAIILIAILLPWFLIPVFFIMIFYGYFATFYRSSARELKRLDAILRSSLYAHFSESLSGLSTIRAYGEGERFRLENQTRLDIENRAYWLTVANQRWLGIRLDFMGISLAFCVSILVVATRFTISPAQTGLALSYILSVQQMFGWLVRQSAELENNMNSVERIVHYGTEIEQEAVHELPDKTPKAPWPQKGELEFHNVVLKYRPELPAVLRNLSISIKAGEKIGIVGRTGAGKSSIMTALYRLVELHSGVITMDGVDISQIGLTDLRSNLAIIPQDPVLFSGTLRSNLDPFSLHDDARLWDALKRSYLLDQKQNVPSSYEDELPSGAQTPSSVHGPRLTLDSVVEDEGGNLSIGQRSLVSLARALVLDTKILILDEATASVDFQTDRHIQDTIASEFQDRTILCIAHRLRTIIGYDRICVLDAGQIAELDTPLNLFNTHDSIFRAMCDRSGIARDDIHSAVKIQQAV